MTHEERLAKAVEFNKKFIASNYTGKKIADEIIVADTLTQEQLDSLIYLYDEWEVGIAYEVGQYRRYNGNLYKVIQTHTSQADWLPDITASLYTLVQPQGVIEEWGTRTLSVNPFMIGEQVKFEGVIYESTINNNVWTPVDYPQGWKVV